MAGTRSRINAEFAPPGAPARRELSIVRDRFGAGRGARAGGGARVTGEQGSA